MRTVAVDYETYYDRDYSVVDLGYWSYCRHPKFDPYLISVCDGTDSWAGPLSDFNFAALEGCRLVAFNSAFDEEVTLAANEQGIISFKTTPADWCCVSNMSRYLFNVGSLKDAVKRGLGIDISKGVRNRAKGKHYRDMVAEGWAEDMIRYALADAQHCYDLWQKAGEPLGCRLAVLDGDRPADALIS